MSSYSLVRRGLVSVALADGTSPKAFALPSNVNPATAILVATVTSVREKVVVQHGQILAAPADTSPKNATITAVGALSRAHVTGFIREIRSAGAGATLKLSSTTQVRLEWLGGALGGGDAIEAEFSVVEHRPDYQGARLRIKDDGADGEIAWDGGALLATESIDARYEIIDLDTLGDDVKELLFRARRILGYMGETMLQDKVTFDTAGNPLTYRLRIFEDEAAKAAATIGIAGDLEAGEIGRINVSAKYVAPKGDVLWRKFELEDTGTNPDE